MITTSKSGIRSVERLLLPRLLLRRSARARSRRSVSSARTPRSRKVGAEALDLLAHDRADVERRTTTAPSRRAVAIACSPATPAPSTSTFAGGDRAGGRHQQREEPRQPVGGEQRRPCSRRRSLCEESASIACARVMRGIDSIAKATTPRRRAARARRVGERREEADQHRARARAARPRRPSALRPARPPRLRRAAPRAATTSRPRPRTRRPRSRPRRPRPARPRREARAVEPPDRVGDERDAALAGSGLFRDADPHGAPTLRSHAVGGKGTGARPGKPCAVGSLLATFSDRARGARPVPARPLGPGDRVRGVAGAGCSAGRGSRLEALQLGGSLHDVGKISVDASVLRKPGPLTEDELGADPAAPCHAGARLVERFEDFAPALPYVLHHHERWDGFGYPHGLERQPDPARGAAARRRGRLRRDDLGPRRTGRRCPSSRRSPSSSAARGRSSTRSWPRRSSTAGGRARSARPAGPSARDLAPSRATTRPRASASCGGSPRR